MDFFDSLLTPVCGVEIRNADEAALDAPLRLMAIAVGSTPHEHNGKGMPMSVAFTTEPSDVPERCRAKVSRDTNA